MPQTRMWHSFAISTTVNAADHQEMLGHFGGRFVCLDKQKKRVKVVNHHDKKELTFFRTPPENLACEDFWGMVYGALV